MIRVAHLLGIIFGLVMILLTYRLYTRKKFSFNVFLIWTIIWLGLIVGILSFEQIKYFSENLIKIEVMDFFLYSSVMVLFTLVFLVYGATRSNQRKIERIVESIALRDAKEKFEVKR